MTGYDAFLRYQAIKLHFTTTSYDYFKYGGKYNCSLETFERRGDKFSFHKLVRLHPSEEELVFFLASNLFIKPKTWVGELNTSQAQEEYWKRRKIKESLEYHIIGDLGKSGVTTIETLRETLQFHGEEVPRLLSWAQNGEVSPETLIVVDALTGCLDKWGNKIADTIIYPQMKLRYRRYAPFLEMDVKKLTNTLKDSFRVS